ncbi:WbqC family protein [Tunicatimonas pelagia]|uniref:WbqC family protein n=1 Tax=Tunicatimonas pelagia TaxID=931531 RepID=UPI002665AC83|nr:WbqC family protein [Tunicatimonas pelagia]WKN44299.1 WbqC family protein [Tunicatimonas pelagia]
MDQSVLIESHYFPCIEYFSLLRAGGKIWIDTDELYVKQSYRNRCYILGPNKIQALSVPIHRGSGKIPTRDVRIANENRWQNNHWRSLASAYGKAPFFAFFADDIRATLYQPFTYLIDLNLALLTKCLELLMWNTEVEFWSYQALPATSSTISDQRGVILGKSQVSGNSQFMPLRYIQAFGKDFVPNLSIIDLLFCEGPHADNVIRRSISER